MKNHFFVNLEEGGYKSTFYWCNIRSLSKLIQSIKTRFRIPTKNENKDIRIFYEEQQVNEEKFTELYDGRFDQGNVDFFLRIPDPNIKIDIKRLLPDSSVTFDIKVVDKTYHYRLENNWTVLDLKRHISKFFYQTYLLQGKVILTDKQHVKDLILDLPVGQTCIENIEVVPAESNFPYVIITGEAVKRLIYYPLMENGSLSEWDMKCWIKQSYGIPCEEQELIHYGSSIQNDMGYGRNVQSLIEYKLVVLYTTDINLRIHYREHGITMIQPIHITSFKGDLCLVYYYQGDHGLGVEQLMAHKLAQIPQQRLIYYHAHRWGYRRRKVEDLDVYFLSDDNWGRPHGVIKFAIQVDDKDTKLLEIVQRLNVSRIRSIKIKYPFHLKKTLKVPFSVLLKDEDKLSHLQIVIEQVCKQWTDISPQNSVLKHERMTITRWHDLFSLLIDRRTFRIDRETLKENLILELEINLSITNRFDQITLLDHSKQTINQSKKVNINFLTGQFSIDLYKNKSLTLNNIRELKEEIYRQKDIQPRQQFLYLKNVHLDDSLKLDKLSRECNDTLVLSLIVKPAMEMNLNIDCQFSPELDTITLKETDTFGDVKTLLKKHSGIPESHITLLYSFGTDEFKDYQQIWECTAQVISNNVHVRAFKSTCFGQ